MAQKIHPLGFRLVTIQKHKSLWYTNFENYSKIICEDTIIRRIIEIKNKIIRKKENNNSINNNDNKDNTTKIIIIICNYFYLNYFCFFLSKSPHPPL